MTLHEEIWTKSGKQKNVSKNVNNEKTDMTDMHKRIK